MNPWKPILAALVIFAAGVITGGLLVSHADRVSQNPRRKPGIELTRPVVNPSPLANPRETPPRPQLSRNPRILSEEFMHRLETEMQLTRGQRERIQEIIVAGQGRNKEIWDRITPELRREMIETQKRIREILTPEQRAKYEELMKQNRQPGRRKAEEAASPENRPQ